MWPCYPRNNAAKEIQSIARDDSRELVNLDPQTPAKSVGKRVLANSSRMNFKNVHMFIQCLNERSEQRG
jgi:hypothetical protein